MTPPPQLGTLETITQAHRSATCCKPQTDKKEDRWKKMSRGGSSGGGRSSLSYLFEPEETILYRTHRTAKSNQETNKSPGTNSSSVIKDDNKATGAVAVQEPPHPHPPKREISDPILSTNKPPCNIYHTSQLSYNNSGLLITDRPSTRVRCAPGGASSLGFLFGEEHEK